MANDTSIFVGAGESDQYLLLKYGNRHGLIAGATGTGKTRSLQLIAEQLSAAGGPRLRGRREGRPLRDCDSGRG